MNKVSLANNEDGLGRVWLILIIIVSVIAVGAIGYTIGKNSAEAAAKNAYDKKVEELQKELTEAQHDVHSDIENGQAVVQTLQDEKNKLEEQLADQQKKIDELEQKLAETNPGGTEQTPGTQTPQ